MGGKRVLRIPAAIAFTVVAGTAGVTTAITACGHGESPPNDGAISDGTTDGSQCELFCIPDGTDAGVCNTCADTMGNCPVGCRPVG